MRASSFLVLGWVVLATAVAMGQPMPDPTSPDGVRTHAKSERPLEITWVQPNHGPPGTVVRVYSSHLATPSSRARVRVGEAPVQDAWADPSGAWVFPAAEVPGRGPLGLQVDGVAAHRSTDDLQSFFVGTSTPLSPIVGGVTPVVGQRTAEGELLADGDRAVFILAGTAGDRLRVDAFARDALTQRLVDPADRHDVPRLEVTIRDALTGHLRATDRDSGPGDNPSVHWTLPVTGRYLVEIATRAGAPGGLYLANLGIDPRVAPTRIPRVLGVSPQLASPGDLITITGTAFEGRPRVSLHGVPFRIVDQEPGKLVVRVPWGAPSGPIQVATDRARSAYLPDDPRVHLGILPGLETSDDRLTIGSHGRTMLDAHGAASWELWLDAGEEVAVEAWALDHIGAHLAAGTGPRALDLRLELQGPGGEGAVSRDDDSGPGLDPRIGSFTRRQGFQAARPGWYRVIVRGRADHARTIAVAVSDPTTPGGPVREWSVPLHVTILREKTPTRLTGKDFRLEQQLERQFAALGVWKQAALRPEVVSLRVVEVAPGASALDSLAALERAVATFAHPGRQDVLVVRSLPGLGGSETVALTLVNDGTVLLASDQLPGADEPWLPVSLAHELGHAFGGLEDLDASQPDNLMQAVLTIQTGAGLSVSQINRVRAHLQERGPAISAAPSGRWLTPRAGDSSPPR